MNMKTSDLLKKEIEIVDPKVVVLFGNQVSKLVLDEKISVSQCRKKKFVRNINGKEYKLQNVHGLAGYYKGRTVKALLSNDKLYANVEGIKSTSPMAIIFFGFLFPWSHSMLPMFHVFFFSP